MKNNELLENNKNDLIASAGRSVAGAAPLVGNLLTELVDNLIPNQRIDRIAHFVIKLEDRLSTIEAETLDARFKDESYLSLLEDGYIHASRAITDERREHIASLVSNGLSDEQIQVSASKYLLNILSELNDAEIIWLRYYDRFNLNDQSGFLEKHKNVITHNQVAFGAPMEKQNNAAFTQSYKDHLERLGLIDTKYKLHRDLKIPEFDTFSGKPKGTKRITRLGRLLLSQTGLSSVD